MEISVKQIAQILGAKVVGDDTRMIGSVAKIQEGGPGDISFLANMKYEEFLYTTKVSAVIVSEGFEPKQPVEAALIYAKDAYAAFTDLLTEYQRMTTMMKVGRETPVYIDDSAQIGQSEYIAAFAYIGKNVKIGNNVKIYPHAFVGDNVVIGDNCILHAGVKVHADTQIGNNCTLQAGAVVGSDGFGFAPQKDGSYKTIPQLGNVILEDNVDIGANTVVDRATMGSTVIRQGAKLDNLIQVAHNVVIGKNTVIASQTGVSGSSEVGENCMVGGQVGIAGHLKVADRTQIAAQSGLAQSVEEAGSRIMGSPALPSTENLKSFMVYRKLPELQRKVRQLEKKILSL